MFRLNLLIRSVYLLVICCAGLAPAADAAAPTLPQPTPRPTPPQPTCNCPNHQRTPAAGRNPRLIRIALLAIFAALSWAIGSAYGLASRIDDQRFSGYDGAAAAPNFATLAALFQPHTAKAPSR